MNIKTTVVLVVLLLAVGAYFVLVERSAPPPQTAAPTQEVGRDGLPLLEDAQYTDATVVSVVIERSVGNVTITKEGENWNQTSPVFFPLSNWSADDLASAGRDLRYWEKFVPGEKGSPSLGEVALDPPTAKVTMTFKDGKPAPVTLLLGRKTVGGRAFLQVQGDKHVCVVKDTLHAQALDKSVNDLRRKNLQAPTESQAQRVRLTRGGETVEAVKSEAGWSFASPHSGRAGSEKVSELINVINAAFVEKFVADAPADLSAYGLDAPQAVLEVEQADEKTPVVKSLRLGAPADLKREAYFATFGAPGDAAVVFTLGKSTMEKLAKGVDDLRDARLSVLKQENVNEIAVSAGAEQYKIIKTPGGWEFADPKPGFELDGGLASGLLEAILGARASGFVVGQAPRGEPTATVTLTAIGSSEPEVLRIFAGAEGPVVYRNQEWVGHRAEVATLTPGALSLRERLVLEVAKQSVNTITIRRPDGVVFEFAREQGSPWALRGFEKYEAGALAKLEEALFPLRAQSWQQVADFAPARKYEVSFGDKTLTVDAENRTAAVNGVPGVFKVGDSVFTAVDAEFRDRTVLPLQVGDIASVKVGEVAIRKDAAGRFVSDGVELDQAAAAGVFDVLAGLRAVRYAPPGEMGAQGGLVVEVNTTSGQTYVLTLVSAERVILAPSRGHEGAMDVFSVEEATYAKLTAELVKK